MYFFIKNSNKSESQNELEKVKHGWLKSLVLRLLSVFQSKISRAPFDFSC